MVHILLMEQMKKRLMMALSRPLLTLAVSNCDHEADRMWIRGNSESFFQLADMFVYLKEKIDEEEKKNHGDHIHIIFVAHGRIRPPMIPASRLLPLAPLRDVILYSPWNCATTAAVTYGISTGKMKPEHRQFYCSKKNGETGSKLRPPSRLPDHWNSLRRAGGQEIPTIIVSPLHPESPVWKKYESLTKQYGPPGRNRVVIPFMVPAETTFGSSGTVPVYVVTLALSLVLLSSRFTATVHLDTCLSKTSADTNLDENLLTQQYSWTMDDTGMTVSEDTFRNSWAGIFQRFFG